MTTPAEGWATLLDLLADAGRTVERPTAPGTALDRAEGYRYLSRITRMGLRMLVEYGDPAHPVLFQANSPTQKLGIDDPDKVYLWATISGAYEYRITGTRGTIGYLGLGVYAGSFGGGGRRTIAHLHGDDIAVDADGRIDLVLSAREQPGNWIRLDPDASTVMIRQTYLGPDEVAADLRIERTDRHGPPPPLDATRLADGLLATGMFVAGSATLFAGLSDQWAQHPNRFTPSDPKLGAEMMGDPDIAYLPGYWRVQPDEALVVEFTPPRCPYWGFVLCNYWQESMDYRYRPGWTNSWKATPEADGSVRLVIAHRDPGVPNWIDTEGHVEGTMLLRFLLPDEPRPLPEPRLVALDGYAPSSSSPQISRS